METSPNDSIIEEVYDLMDAGVGLMFSIHSEHLESINPPKNWGDPYNYDNLSKKFNAMLEIFSCAFTLLDIAETGSSNKYSDKMIKHLAELIEESKEKV